VKDVGGKVFAEGWIPATRFDLDRWMKTILWNRSQGSKALRCFNHLRMAAIQPFDTVTIPTACAMSDLG
jgi:hypothetical protein